MSEGKRFRTVVADPPWAYEGKTPPWRSTSEQSYPLLTTDEIMALPVPDLAADDAHLYLWAVLPLLPDAFRVVEAWGFTYTTTLTWCKPGVGLGGGYRGNTEHLLVARKGFTYINPTCETCKGRARGSRKCRCGSPDWRHFGQPVTEPPALPFRGQAAGTWYEAPRGAHSAKPDLFLDLIERMSPGPYLELFARRARFGWDYWGDESLQTVDLAA